MEYDIYSDRERAEQGPDPYQYEEIPEELRNQIIRILEDVINTMTGISIWSDYWDNCCREKGLPQEYNYPKLKWKEYLMAAGVKDVLDIIDITFQFLERHLMNRNRTYLDPSDPYHFVISEIQKLRDELNSRFEKKSVGFKLVGNRMMRTDSEFPHAEMVVPALSFLRGEGFEEANEKFLEAHEHYRNDRYQDCVTCCHTALESVLKKICKQKGFKGKETVDGLIKTLSNKGFIPRHLQEFFEKGVPPLRHNQSSSHDAEKTPRHAAAFALHLTASNILFLVQEFNSGLSSSAKK